MQVKLRGGCTAGRGRCVSQRHCRTVVQDSVYSDGLMVAWTRTAACPAVGLVVCGRLRERDATKAVGASVWVVPSEIATRDTWQVAREGTHDSGSRRGGNTVV